MRQLAAVAGLILLVGIVGSLLTFVIYILAGLVAFGLSVMLVGWIGEKITWRQAGKRIRATAASVERKAATLEDEAPETLPEDLRHPAWKTALDRRTEERARLARRYCDLRYRAGSLAANADYTVGYFDRETRSRELDESLREVEALVRKTFGVTRPTTIVIGVDNKVHGVDLAPPRSEVLHLGRRFSLVADCRYGHCAQHNIIGVTGAAGEGKGIDNVPVGRLLRECDVCQPATRWTENP